MAELQKKYTKACQMHDPTLLKETKDHAKALHNPILSACFDTKHKPKSETLFAELVFLNHLVVTLLLKQISTGIANLLYAILTAIG